MKKQGNTIFHLQFKDTGSDHYFGSIAAIYDTFPIEKLGISKWSLYNFHIEINKPYINKICIIKKGNIISKPGNRRKVKRLNKINVNG